MAIHQATADAIFPTERRKLVELVDYVAHLARLTERPILELKSYGQAVFPEAEFRDRIGISHDETDDDGPIWLTIERLQRINPPAPAPLAKPWLTIARDPFKQPAVASMRRVTVTCEEAEEFVTTGKATPDNVSGPVKPIDGLPLAGCRDVCLRWTSSPTSMQPCWPMSRDRGAAGKSEKPRRHTITLYELPFSLMQLLENDSAEWPLELVWGIGLARWKRDVTALDHPLVEQLVELEIDQRAALLVRPRNVAPQLHLEPFEGLQIDGTAMVRREAQVFLDAATTPSLSPFDRTSFETVLRLAVH